MTSANETATTDCTNHQGIEMHRRFQEEIYEKDGMTLERVAQIPQIITDRSTEYRRDKKLKDGGTDDVVLYVNSSDPLKELPLKEVKGKRVLTVAGSGDIPSVFIDAGAAQVDIFDRSMTACLFTELKLRAVEVLSQNQFKALFGTAYPPDFDGKISIAILDKLKSGRRIFDTELYQKVRPLLSQHARSFCDAVAQDPDGGHLSTLFYDDSDNIRYLRSRGVYRYRSKQGAYLGEHNWSSEQMPVCFQGKISEHEWSIRNKSISDPTLDVGSYDLIYISNIGWRFDDILETVRNLLRRGAKKIWFTWNPHMSPKGLFSPTPKDTLPNERMRYIYNKTVPLGGDSFCLLPRLIPIEPGEQMFFYWIDSQVEMTIKAVDPSVDLMYCSEMTSEANPPPIKKIEGATQAEVIAATESR
ncbi:MAG: hypothetical protein AAB606_01225 [Patescibacteria group bacterium]